LHLAEKTLEEFEDAPLFGQGFGTTLYWSGLASHNLYLSLIADLGVAGIIVIPALVLSVGRRSWDSYAFAVVFLLWCFFDHMVLSDSFALISLAIQADESCDHCEEKSRVGSARAFAFELS
jgi:O-antigen ligase